MSDYRSLLPPEPPDVPDILTIAVSGVDYYQSNGSPLPESLMIRWAVGAHPCDDRPYLIGLDFP